MTATPKWFARYKDDIEIIFSKIQILQVEFKNLTTKFLLETQKTIICDYDLKNLINDCQNAFQLYDEIRILTGDDDSGKGKSTIDNIQRTIYTSVLKRKYKIISDNLHRFSCQLLLTIQKFHVELLNRSQGSPEVIELSMHLVSIVNENSRGYKSIKSGSVCSNSFPSLLLSVKKIDIGLVLKLLCSTRQDIYAMAILAELYGYCNKKVRRQPQKLRKTISSASSVEILNTLTSNMDVKTEVLVVEETDKQAAKTTDMLKSMILFLKTLKWNFRNRILKMEEFLILLAEEESFLASFIIKFSEICPSAFAESVDNVVIEKWTSNGIKNLWSLTGSILDHILLWWNDLPLTSFPVMHTMNLREWILTQKMDDAPDEIVFTLLGLSEILTSFVSNNTWDEQLRATFIEDDLPFQNLQEPDPGTENMTDTGKEWNDIFHNLANLNNSCCQRGTIANQLPIVEQIPILHRADHSVHSFRLWALERAKVLCNDWQMTTFYKVLEADIKLCLNELLEMQFPVLVASLDSSDVNITVCVALRSKLVDEAKGNIHELKNTTNECIQIMSDVCRTLSLAKLMLFFPPPAYWQARVINENSGDYVNNLLQEILYPVLRATKDVEMLSLVLKIICEAWLDFIYIKKVRFSVSGAVNLLRDFDGVHDWIINCTLICEDHMDKLSKHEVLRMCKGVGKILLRKPEDVVTIASTPKHYRAESDAVEEGTKLPSEMFVPNQKHWLKLRARADNDYTWLCSN